MEGQIFKGEKIEKMKSKKVKFGVSSKMERTEGERTENMIECTRRLVELMGMKEKVQVERVEVEDIPTK